MRHYTRCFLHPVAVCKDMFSSAFAISLQHCFLPPQKWSKFQPYFIICLTCKNTWISMTLSTVFKGSFFTHCKFHLKVITYHGDAYSKKVHYGHGSSSKVCLLYSRWQTAMRFIWLLRPLLLVAKLKILGVFVLKCLAKRTAKWKPDCPFTKWLIETWKIRFLN